MADEAAGKAGLAFPVCPMVEGGVSGTHDGFPAYEVIIERPESGNTSTTVYTHNPNDTNQTPASLYPPEEFEIKQEEKVIEPQPKTRQRP